MPCMVGSQKHSCLYQIHCIPYVTKHVYSVPYFEILGKGYRTRLGQTDIRYITTGVIRTWVDITLSVGRLFLEATSCELTFLSRYTVLLSTGGFFESRLWPFPFNFKNFIIPDHSACLVITAFFHLYAVGCKSKWYGSASLSGYIYKLCSRFTHFLEILDRRLRWKVSGWPTVCVLLLGLWRGQTILLSPSMTSIVGLPHSLQYRRHPITCSGVWRE